MPQTLHPLRCWAESHAGLPPATPDGEPIHSYADEPTQESVIAPEGGYRCQLPVDIDVETNFEAEEDAGLASEELSLFRQILAWGGSLGLHVALLVGFSLIYLIIPVETDPLVISSLVTDLSEEVALPEIEHAEDTWNVSAEAAVSFSPARIATEDSREGLGRGEMIQDPIPDPIPWEDIEVPEEGELSLAESLDGLQGEIVNTVDDFGSVDRLTMEILQHLKEKKVLVVWLMDASESLSGRREQVIRRFDRIYQELDELAEREPDVLQTSVVAFGESPTLMTKEPTSDRNTIRKAVRDIPVDRSGIENICTAIRMTAAEYRKAARKGYKVMLMVLTDESGNDLDLLDQTVAAVKQADVSVYVMGPMAPFSRREIKVKWVDPDTSEVYRLPVERGPATLLVEYPSLPECYTSKPARLMSSGFGPFALARLARETGGIYFAYDDGEIPEPGFDIDSMRDYAPDYLDAAAYQDMIEKHPLRLAVLRTSMALQETKLPQPKARYLAAGIQFAIRESFRDLERLYDITDKSLAVLQEAGKFYEREPSKRWRAHYDLLMGQLLVRRILIANSLPHLNSMYTKPEACTDVTCNAWELAGVPGSSLDGTSPDESADANDAPPQDRPEGAAKAESPKTRRRRVRKPQEDPTEQRQIELASKHLQRAVTQNPGTPWAIAAGMELRTPLTLEWKETFVVPPDGEKLPWDKPPGEFKKLSKSQQESLLAAKEKFIRLQRFRREKQQEKKTLEPQTGSSAPKAKRRIPKL